MKFFRVTLVSDLVLDNRTTVLATYIVNESWGFKYSIKIL